MSRAHLHLFMAPALAVALFMAIRRWRAGPAHMPARCNRRGLPWRSMASKTCTGSWLLPLPRRRPVLLKFAVSFRLIQKIAIL
jgi:hypothetical protein